MKYKHILAAICAVGADERAVVDHECLRRHRLAPDPQPYFSELQANALCAGASP